MRIYDKELNLYGDPVCATIILDGNNEELVRLLVTGSWAGPQDLSKATENMLVDQCPDGSFTISVQKPISASIAEDQTALDEEVDKVLNHIEDVLGLDQMSLSSDSSNVGHRETKWDYLMNDGEQRLVREATK